MDHFALDADPFAVNYSHAPESFLVGQSQVFFNHRFYVARRNSVKIKHVRDLNFHRLGKWIVEIDVAHRLI